MPRIAGGIWVISARGWNSTQRLKSFSSVSGIVPAKRNVALVGAFVVSSEKRVGGAPQAQRVLQCGTLWHKDAQRVSICHFACGGTFMSG